MIAAGGQASEAGRQNDETGRQGCNPLRPANRLGGFLVRLSRVKRLWFVCATDIGGVVLRVERRARRGSPFLITRWRGGGAVERRRRRERSRLASSFFLQRMVVGAKHYCSEGEGDLYSLYCTYRSSGVCVRKRSLSGKHLLFFFRGAGETSRRLAQARRERASERAPESLLSK